MQGEEAAGQMQVYRGRIQPIRFVTDLILIGAPQELRKFRLRCSMHAEKAAPDSASPRGISRVRAPLKCPCLRGFQLPSICEDPRSHIHLQAYKCVRSGSIDLEY